MKLKEFIKRDLQKAKERREKGFQLLKRNVKKYKKSFIFTLILLIMSVYNLFTANTFYEVLAAFFLFYFSIVYWGLRRDKK
jgi:hypothetical protein